jgi:hypothetical protein
LRPSSSVSSAVRHASEHIVSVNVPSLFVAESMGLIINIIIITVMIMIIIMM